MLTPKLPTIHAFCNRGRAIAVTALLFLPAIASLDACAQLSPRELARQTLPSVVTIRTYDEDGSLSGNGSGFVVGPDGLVMTNSHVIESSASIDVLLPSGRRARVLGIVAADPDVDYALIHIEAARLPALTVASESEPEIGERVLAAGAPLGLSGSVSDGIVSQLRQREPDDENPVGRVMIQHTAPVSPGNSGGPLVNEKGEVIGMNTDIKRGGDALNFALPAFYLRAPMRAPSRDLIDLKAYQQHVVQLRAKREEEAFAKQFIPYTDPDGVVSMRVPRAWNVERDVRPDEKTGGTRIRLTIRDPDSVTEWPDALPKTGLCLEMQLPPASSQWDHSQRQSWLTNSVKPGDSLPAGETWSPPLSKKIGNVEVLERLAYTGSGEQEESSLRSLAVLADPSLLLRIDIRTSGPAHRTFERLRQILSQSLELKGFVQEPETDIAH